ncbi:MAG: hypothetical protein ABIT76_14035 [Chthoniobacterales bacterium]
MRETFIELQRRIEMLPGVLRAGICLHNRMVIFADFKSPADQAIDETIWRALADTIQVAHLHKLGSPRMSWNFERVKVLCMISAKGTTLGVIVDKNSNDELGDRIERVFRTALERTVF